MGIIRLSRLLPLVGLLAVGCTNLETKGSQTIPLKDALALVETELRDAYPVALSDIGTASEDKIRTALIKAQSFDKSPDPLIPVITGTISIGLQGQFQQQAAAQLGAIFVAPAGQLSYQITQQEQQSLTVPLTFVTLRGLPDFYMGQNLANFSNLAASDHTRTRLTAHIVARREHLASLVKETIDDYPSNSGQCPANSGPPSAAVPLDLKGLDLSKFLPARK